MRNLKLLISIFIVLIFSCSCRQKEKYANVRESIEKIKEKENVLSVYRLYNGCCKNEYYKLLIDNNFKYIDSLGSAFMSPPGVLLVDYIPMRDTISIYLKIGERDTTFIYNRKGIKKILIGMPKENSLGIYSEKDENAWLAE